LGCAIYFFRNWAGRVLPNFEKNSNTTQPGGLLWK
jgi:hypothetical protein